MPTSLSNCLTSKVISLITRRGASSESLMIKVDTDFGPLVSLLLNSLLLISLQIKLATAYAVGSIKSRGP